MAIIIPPTGEELERKFLPYAIQLGKLVYAWNQLHESLGQLFWTVLGETPGATALAVWYSTNNDRAQREMLRAAAVASLSIWSSCPPKALEDILWLLGKIQTLADQRNDTIHSPFTFNVDADGAKLISSYVWGHPRALKLKGKDLMAEFKWYCECADTCTRFTRDVREALISRGRSWPDRPQLPRLDQFQSRKPVRPQKPAKSRPRPPRRSRA
jgi:hypothetical protein